MYDVKTIYESTDCVICHEPLGLAPMFCGQHDKEFNTWYRLGMDRDWVGARERLNLPLGTDALVEWVNQMCVYCPCAACNQRASDDDYLCGDCRDN